MLHKNYIIGAVLGIAVVIYAGASSTVVKQGEEATLTGEVQFDPAAIVATFWQQKANAYFDENAVDLKLLLEESSGEFDSVAKKYGHYSMGDSGELSFIVKGSGTISVVKNKLRSGYLGFKLDGYDGNIDTRLQIGPVFKGSAVRDSISLINYKDYKNQIEWAQISVAFHDLITKQILSEFDMNQVNGKHVDFTGCFTVTRPGQILITPVKLSIK